MDVFVYQEYKVQEACLCLAGAAIGGCCFGFLWQAITQSGAVNTNCQDGKKLVSPQETDQHTSDRFYQSQESL
jgi:hypothetical protein